MSAQSIIDIEVKDICRKIDEYLICEGKYFINIIDYDLKGKIDYDKLDTVLWLSKLIDNCDDEKTLLIIDKILRI